MKNYRTLLAGIGLAIFVGCLPIIQKGDFDIRKDWPYLIGAALSAISGYLQKDAKESTNADEKTADTDIPQTNK